MLTRFNDLRQLAVIVAFATNLVAYLLLWILGVLDINTPGYLFLSFIISGTVTYVAVLITIREFVFRKVKPIYKLIRKSKINSAEDRKQFMSDDIISRVEDEVRDWVTKSESERADMESLEAYRRDFLGNISHELKTPIFNMQGYVHSLLDGAMYEKKYLKSFLLKAAKNIDRLNTIVQDLDLINKIESNTITLEVEKFVLNDLVQEVIEELKDVSSTKKIRVFVKDGVNKSFKVKADRNAIRQVLTNLITNSVKYGVDDGITKIGFYDMDKYILVEVTDNGRGIAAEHLDHVFDRFYRTDKSRVRGEGGVEGGSGLGLAIVKHLVEAHDQTISVRSTEGIGSTFGFTLAKA